MTTDGRYAAHKVVRREPCPRCRAGGGDRKGDNRHVYLDGHEHCYACGMHKHADVTIDTLRRLVEREQMNRLEEVADELSFPRDYMPLGISLHSKPGYSWIKKWGITDEEIKKHSIGWSTDQQMLIFPVYDTAGRMVMWQGRNFNGGPKYITKGEKSEVINLVGNEKSGTVVLTEDLISAIKVGRVFQAMPIWGASVAVGVLQKLGDRFDDLCVWLDRNKTLASVQIALRASQYLPSCVVSSQLDPKEYSQDTITSMIWSAQATNTVYKDDPNAGKTSVSSESPPKSLETPVGVHPFLYGPDGKPLNFSSTEREWDYREAYGS